MGRSRQRAPADEPTPAAGEKKRVSLMVGREAGAMVNKIKEMRELGSVEELFNQPDFQDFLRHMLWAEVKKEADRLRPPGQKP